MAKTKNRLRVPRDVVDDLRDNFHARYDHRPKGRKPKFKVGVSMNRGASRHEFHYIAYLADAQGNRIPGTRNYPFAPTRYARKRKPTAPPPAVQVGGTEAELEKAAQNVPIAEDLGRDAY